MRKNYELRSGDAAGAEEVPIDNEPVVESGGEVDPSPGGSELIALLKEQIATNSKGSGLFERVGRSVIVFAGVE